MALIGSGWLFRQLESSAPAGRVDGREPDFYMTDFVSLAMDAQGRPGRELRAARTVHFADSDTQELTDPRLCFRLDQPKPWCVVAEHGWISSDHETVRLLGEVHLWQRDGHGGSALDLYTRDVTVLPTPEEAHTEAPARIVAGWGETEGVGLRARLGDGQLQLLSRVRTRHDPERR
jgi:LPS export ABC transporter protein LptC